MRLRFLLSYPATRFALCVGLALGTCPAGAAAAAATGGGADTGETLGGAAVADPPGTAVDLDESALLRSLATLGSAEVAGRSAGDHTVELPLGPAGAPVAYSLRPSGSLAPGLRTRFPQLRAYVGQSAEVDGREVRLEYAPGRGFTAAGYDASGRQILALRAADGAFGAPRRYFVNAEVAQTEPSSAFVCGVGAEPGGRGAARPAPGRASLDGACVLRRYRLAIATTGEYARAVAGPEASVAEVLGEINVAVNRVNAIYERDLGITFELVTASASLVNLDPEVDSFDVDASGISLARDGQAFIDEAIGVEAYDVGHLFHAPASGASGVALRKAACRDNIKATAVTGTADPTDERFYVDYFAHELGHQFGANHTANNDCDGQRNPGTAYEPGSGSTIMGYAGVCAPNVQASSDDYFHAASIEEVRLFIADADVDCSTPVERANAAPTVTVPEGPITIPVGTPFALLAEGSDPDGDRLTYTWEQFDRAPGSTGPPRGTNRVGPLFRSLPPSASPLRRFPAGLPARGTFAAFEILPEVARELNFRVTARDNRPGGGCTASADVALSVTDDAGPFQVTAFDARDTLAAGEQVAITWDVAGTSTAPVSAQVVDVSLTVDGGLTDTALLLAATPNDGSAVVTVPEVLGDSARFIVSARGNVFYAVSQADLLIAPGVDPAFTLEADTAAVSTCGDGVAYALEVESVGGFAEPVALSVVGLPDGAEGSLSQTTGTGAFDASLTVTLDEALASGVYGFRVLGEGGGLSRELGLTLTRERVPAAAPTLTSPRDGADVGAAVTPLAWTAATGAGRVRAEVSTDPQFAASSTTAVTVSGREASFPGLLAGVYYVRLAYVNDCGRGPWSPVRSFRRLRLVRREFSSSAPVTIGNGAPNVATSAIDVSRAGTVYRVQASVDVTHTYIGDVDGALRLPRGDTVELFAPVLEGSCDEEDLEATFADTAAATIAETLGVCGPSDSGPSVSGVFRPVTPFADGLPREAAGVYTLVIADNGSGDGGAITEWSVALWYADDLRDSLTVVTDTVALLPERDITVTAERLRATGPRGEPDSIRWVVKRLPRNLTVALDGSPLTAGDAFSQTQVDAGLLSVAHAPGADLGTTALALDLLGPAGAYRPNLSLPIRVAPSTLSAELAVARDIACAGEADAALAVEVSGGSPPYRFSFNGGPFAAESQLDGIGPGAYAVVVRDALGTEVSTGEAEISEPEPLRLAADAVGDEITALATGGTGEYTYDIGAGTSQASGTFADLRDGTYVVRVTDANGCVDSQEAVIANAPALRVTTQVFTPVPCAGEGAIVRATATGGDPPYAYALDGAAPQDDRLFPRVLAGDHVLVATDDNGRTARTAFTITEPPALSLTSAVTGRAVSLFAEGGTPPYRFRLGEGVFGEASEFADVADGAYAIAVRDRAGCEASGSLTVAGPPPPPVIVGVDVLTEVSCAGASDGRASVIVEGGVPPYTLRLADAGLTTRGVVLSGLTAGDYLVTAADEAGVSSEPFAFSLAEPMPLRLTPEVDGAFVGLGVVGGTPPYTFRRGGQQGQPDSIFGPLAAGTYGFSVRDTRGCVTSATATVTDVGLDVSVALTLARESCPGAADGAVTLEGVGGVPPYAYALSGGPYRASDFFGGLAAGTYTASVRDGLGNVASRGFEIGARPSPDYGVDVSGSRVVVVGAPAGERTMYSFDGGVTFGPDSVGFVYDAGPVEVIAQSGGCDTRLAATVASPLTLSTELAFDCAADAPPTLLACVEGGVGEYRVETSAGDVAAAPTDDCPARYSLALPVGLTIVTVSVSDSTGAALEREVGIAAGRPFELALSTDGETVTVEVTGGRPPYRYAINEGPAQESPTFPIPDSTGEATLTVTDSNGCEVTERLTYTPTRDRPAVDLGLRVYPNPSRGILHVEWADEWGPATLTLLDAAGRVVRERAADPATATSLPWDVTGLPAGHYLLRVRAPVGTATAAVVLR